MFNTSRFENSGPGGIGLLEIVAPEPLLFVPLKRTELRGEVVGPLAALRLIQVFGFSRAQCEHVIEAVYRFPMPGDAAVREVEVRFGTVSIRAELKKREQTEADYQAARAEGRQATLATRESPDVFTLQVAGIAPDEDVTVETLYVQLARDDGAGWSLRLPLTTAPRYSRGDERGYRHSAGQPLALMRDPGHRFALDLNVGGAEAIASPTHALAVKRDGTRLRVRLREGEVLPDRDCVLTWNPSPGPERPALEVFTYDDADSGLTYFLALVAPPATHDSGRGVPREVILLVDHSGSMNGPKWQAADWAVERFLGDLNEHDAFGLALFHNTTHWFDKTLRAAQGPAVKSAITFLKAQRDRGGTEELGVALEQALSLPRIAAEHARHILIITDAEGTDGGRILRLAEDEAQRDDRRRVSILCIDAAPNSFLALELAERGGGVARFLTSEPEEEDITTALDSILADWSEPVLTDLRLELDRPDAQAVGREVSARGEISVIDLGDLPADRPLWVAGRVPTGEARGLSCRLVAAHGFELASRTTEKAGDLLAGPALKALFGARRVLALENLIHSPRNPEELQAALRRLDYDPQEVLHAPAALKTKVYAKNTRQANADALKALLAREALEFGLASSETAFLATRREAGKPVEERMAVANAVPSVWSSVSVAARAGGGGGGGMRMFATLSAPRRPRSRAVPPTPAATNDTRSESSVSDFGLDFAQASVPPRPPLTSPEKGLLIVFWGVPALTDGEAVLFDSTKDRTPFPLPFDVTLLRLVLQFPDGDPDPKSIDPDLGILLFVEDLASPRAKVRIADLARLGGERPLNVQKDPGQPVRLVLVDPKGAWSTHAPWLEVFLGW